jgi:hypothetical protein
VKIIECPQYSPDWWEARRGVPTCSQFHRIIQPKKGQLSASAMPYIHELIADRIKFDPPLLTEQPATPAMRYGTAQEPEARSHYELVKDVDVRLVGFVKTDDERFGGSPDGLVGDDGGLEIKCPDLKTHVGYLLADVLPDDYRAQVHGHLAITGRKWWDFISYHKDSPRQFITRVCPDDFTEQLKDVLQQFWALYSAAWSRILALRTPTPTEASV